MTSFAFVIREATLQSPSKQGRYEYRIWPRRTPPIVPALQRDWALDGAETRGDIYLLSSNSAIALVKLRDGRRLEIKRRGQDCGNLQHWWVVLSEDFPLPPSALRQLAIALLIPDPLPQTACLSPAHLLAALQKFDDNFETLTVRKSRLSFRQVSCRAEITRVVWANRTGLTIALEDPDPSHAERAIQALELGHWPNRSYGDVLCARPLLTTKPTPMTHET
jgi:hypothetical protein